MGYLVHVRAFRFEAWAGRPGVVAHRGAADRALENSLEAFRIAVADGADMIEFDVRLTADGDPAVVHDDRTGRTARENVAVAAVASARLRAVRLRNGEPVPFLADVLDVVRGAVPLNIEIKAADAMGAVRRALRETGYVGDVLLSSSLREECEAARALMPELPCGLVTGRPSASDLAFCRRLALPSIHPDHRSLTVLRIRKVAAAGVFLVPYTVNDADRFFRLVDGGAAGVFSDRARDLRKAWEARRVGG